MQNWRKLNLIFCADSQNSKMVSHAAVPFLEHLNGSLHRIYFSSRDSNNKTSIFYLDYDIDSRKILALATNSILDPGRNGFFDHDGVMGCQFVVIGKMRYIFYQGWNLGVSVPFRNSLGVARFENNILKRVFTGPILDRSPFDPCFVASSWIIKIKEKYIMYYLSCFDWREVNNKLRHYYHIKLAESDDGLTWKPMNKVAIDLKYSNEYAISTPRVLYENNIYKMWYSYRGGIFSENYRIGYAESLNGFDWIRKDETINFINNHQDWDSEMQCYPCIFDYGDNRYMLYNGNEYGKTGFGIAVLEK